MNILIKLLFLSLGVILFFPSLKAQKLDHVQGELLIMFQKNTDIDAWARDLQTYKGKKTNLQLSEQISIPLNIWSVKYDYTQVSGYRLLAYTKEQSEVLAAQFNHYTQYRNQPNDPEYNRQWPFFNTGQTGGTAGVDLDLEAAWDITTGGLTPSGDTIVICVIDDGLDPSHQDFGDNLWVNYAEIPDNGIDDDNNGFVDDYRGWNAFFDNDDIDDTNVHGTPVTGLIGAKGNNNLGIAGVNWDVKLMIVSGGANRESENIQAYSYALTHRQRYNQTAGQEGAFVVATNFSQGIPLPDDVDEEFPLWCALLDSLGEAGILNVASAPNEEVDVDIAKDYPADCASDFLVMVTSVDANGQYAGRGFGSQTIDLASFGEQVWTTTNLNGYGPETGTSFAAPLVSGAIGLLYSSPCLSLKAIADSDPASAALLVKEYLYQGVIEDPSLDGKIFTEGWLNINNSIQLYLNACTDCNPATGLIAEDITDREATLSWKINDSITRVDLRWRIIGEENWTEVTQADPGLQLTDLQACTTYEIQLRSYCGETILEYGSSYFFKTDGCCEPPFDVEPILLNEDRALLAWTPLLAANSYNVRYREINTTDWQQEATPTASLFVLDLQACTDYEVQVQTVCESTQTSFSPSFFFQTGGCGACRDNDYCVVRNANNDGEWIEEFHLGDFSNKSGKDATPYVDFTDLEGPVLALDSTYELLLIPGFDPRPFSQYFRIWIDYDQNGIFSSDEIAFDPGSAVRDSLSGAIVIPPDALTGSTRMRVMMNFSVAGSACQLSGNGNSVPGEVEDYCVTIVEELVPCCAPDMVDTLSTGFNELEIGWTTQACGTTGHIIRYRPLGTEEWLNDITQTASIILGDLTDCTAYEVQVQGLCGAAFSDFTDTFVFTTDCLTNTEDFNKDPFQINVFPNPARNLLNINLHLVKGQTLSYRLLNLNGQTLIQQTETLAAGSQQLQLDVNTLSKGVYFLQVESNTEVAAKKVIIQ